MEAFKYFVVTSIGLSVRKNPDANSDRLDIVYKDHLIKAKSTNDELWVETKYKSYIHKKYLLEITEEEALKLKRKALFNRYMI